jgi:hypothetical protein
MTAGSLVGETRFEDVDGNGFAGGGSKEREATGKTGEG